MKIIIWSFMSGSLFSYGMVHRQSNLGMYVAFVGVLMFAIAFVAPPTQARDLNKPISSAQGAFKHWRQRRAQYKAKVRLVTKYGWCPIHGTPPDDFPANERILESVRHMMNRPSASCKICNASEVICTPEEDQRMLASEAGWL